MGHNLELCSFILPDSYVSRILNVRHIPSLTLRRFTREDIDVCDPEMQSFTGYVVPQAAIDQLAQISKESTKQLARKFPATVIHHLKDRGGYQIEDADEETDLELVEGD